MPVALLLAIALIVGCASADAADYPSKPIRVVIPYAAGSTGEAAFRIIANEVEPHLGKPFVVEARPGAAGNVGAGFVASPSRELLKVATPPACRSLPERF